MNRSTPPIPSPCNSICRMDAASGWCLGCARTLPEIAAWAGLGDEDKQGVWAQLPARRRALGVKFQGVHRVLPASGSDPEAA